MQKYVKTGLIALAFVAMSAFADEGAEGHEGHHGKGPKDPHCAKIHTACEAKFKGKAAFKECMHPILEGKTVDGVTVDAADVEACKKHHEANHGKPGYR